MLLAAGVALWLVLVFAYTWPERQMVLYRLLFDGGMSLLWIGAAGGFGSRLLPLFPAAGPAFESPLLRAVTAIASGLGAMSLMILGLGLSGWLNQATAFGLIGAGIAAGIARLFWTRWKPEVLAAWLNEPAGWQWLGIVAVPFAAVMTAGALLPPPMLWTPDEPHGYDVVEYHLQVPREWFEAGRIVPLHHNVFSFFPFNVEMHYLLAMHLRGGPWAGMYLAQFMHSQFISLAALAACAFAMRRSLPLPGGIRESNLAPVLVFLAMAATPLLPQLGAIAYDEGGFILFSTLAIGWAARALSIDDGHATSRFALAGVMTGLACGSKLTAVPEVLVAIALAVTVLLFVLTPLRRQPIRLRMANLIVFAATAVLCFAPWMIRTWKWSGNPVFPELPSVLGHGHFTADQVERWHNAHLARPDQQSLHARVGALGGQVLVNWQYGYLLIPLALLGFLVPRRGPDAWLLGIMLFLLAVFWCAFTHLQGRFFVLAIPICAMLIARLPRWLPRSAALLVIAQAIVAFILLHRQFLPHMIPEAIGRENIGAIFEPEAMKNVPPDAAVALVGDARAFVYSDRPMSMLSYRTVFDVSSGSSASALDAWAGPPPAKGSQWLLIDPLELQRFEKTYHPLPQLSLPITGSELPFVLRR